MVLPLSTLMLVVELLVGLPLSTLMLVVELLVGLPQSTLMLVAVLSEPVSMVKLESLMSLMELLD